MSSSNEVIDVLSSSDKDRVVGGDGDWVVRGDKLDARVHNDGWYRLGPGDGERIEGGVGVMDEVRMPDL
jgi:hypothetical protein